ncbi:hypothetical protein [Mitsuaria sp. 7]|uniref:hypothetical protein n=1 Tax=Mitsuaria sp. 7 TaxID=1658665 RepID=UPI0012FC6913|nr:hypothetical protein [Mitsuaria sp. 7]
MTTTLLLLSGSIQAQELKLHEVTRLRSASVAASVPVEPTDLSVRSQASPYIEIYTPKVYNNFALRVRLEQIKDRIATLQGIDASKLTQQLGTIQGASVQRVNAAIQANALPTAGVVNKATTTTPAGTSTTLNTTELTQNTASPAGATTPGAASTVAKESTSLQLMTPMSQGSGTDVTTTTTSFTPSIPTLPSAGTFAAPTQVSQGALNALAEQVQLEMELATVQTLLESPLNSEYSPNGNGRMQVTIGVPISVPAMANYETRGEAVEVLVAVCAAQLGSPQAVPEAAKPLLVNLIPREKTYNIAAITNKSFGVGLGAIAGVFSVAGNFSWTRDTYYIVRAQDTVALLGHQSSPYDGVCEGGARPLRFGWLFKPVLGQEVVSAGLREALVQLSIPRPDRGATMRMFIETRWRKFEKKTGTVGRVIEESRRSENFNVPALFDTLNVLDIAYRDARQNNSSISIAGHFLRGTKVRLGNTEVIGVENTGRSLEFIASNAALATANIIVVSPDGEYVNLDRSLYPPLTAAESSDPRANIVLGSFANDHLALNDCLSSKDPVCSVGKAVFATLDPKEVRNARIKMKGGNECAIVANDPERPWGGASVRLKSSSIAEVTLPIKQCLSIKPIAGEYPLIARIGDSLFGFPGDRLEIRGKEVVFDAPRSVVENSRIVELSRFLLGEQYRNTYRLDAASHFRVDSIALNSVLNDRLTFLVLGNNLEAATTRIVPTPLQKSVVVYEGGVALEFALSKKTAESVKKVFFQNGDKGANDKSVFVFDLPQAEVKKQAKTEPEDPRAFKMTLTGTLPKQ